MPGKANIASKLIFKASTLNFFFWWEIYRLWGGVGKGKPNQILKATSAYSTDSKWLFICLCKLQILKFMQQTYQIYT